MSALCSAREWVTVSDAGHGRRQLVGSPGQRRPEWRDGLVSECQCGIGDALTEGPPIQGIRQVVTARSHTITVLLYLASALSYSTATVRA